MTCVATRAAKAILSDIDPFSRYVLHRPLRQYQLEPARAILQSILHGEGETFAVMMSRQAGKNELSAQIEAYLLNIFQRTPGQLVKAAPTFKPQAMNSLMRLQERLNNPWNARAARRVENYMIQLGAARALFFSASAEANVVGATASILLEADEAQDIAPTKWLKDFLPMVASSNATRVYWGTAWSNKTLLAQVIAGLRQKEAKDGKKRVFLADWQTVAAEVPKYGEYVSAEIQRLGPTHPLIRTQYKLETIDDSGGMFTAARQALMHGQHERQRNPTPGHAYALLIDVAGGDESAASRPIGHVDQTETKRDATGITIVEINYDGPRPVYLVRDRWRRLGVRQAALMEQIPALIEHWQPSQVLIDATGIGAGLASHLVDLYGHLIATITFTAKLKAELGWGFIGLIESGRYKEYINDEAEDTRQFWYEVGACAFESTSHERLKWGVWEAPSYDGLIATGHDDLLISASLAALLDTAYTGPAESIIIPTIDPLARHTSW
jgi:hypothetical protein